jgi:hypothetical protein
MMGVVNSVVIFVLLIGKLHAYRSLFPGTAGELDIRLTSLYCAWSKVDAPPGRVKPLPTTVVAQVWSLAQLKNSSTAQAAAEILALGV